MATPGCINVDGAVGSAALAKESSILVLTANEPAPDDSKQNVVCVIDTNNCQVLTKLTVPNFTDFKPDIVVQDGAQTEILTDLESESSPTVDIFKRCAVTGDGIFAVISEEDETSKEFYISIKEERFLYKSSDTYTLLARDNETFVSFGHSSSGTGGQQLVIINIITPCQDCDQEQGIKLERVAELKFGKQLLTKPALLPNKTLIGFSQISKTDKQELCIFDLEMEPEAIICKATAAKLNLPEDAKFSTMLPMSRESEHMLVLYKGAKDIEGSSAFIWKIDTELPRNGQPGSGQVLKLFESDIFGPNAGLQLPVAQFKNLDGKNTRADYAALLKKTEEFLGKDNVDRCHDALYNSPGNFLLVKKHFVLSKTFLVTLAGEASGELLLVRLSDSETRDKMQIAKKIEKICHMEVSPDGQTLVLVTRDGEIQLCKISDSGKLQTGKKAGGKTKSSGTSTSCIVL